MKKQYIQPYMKAYTVKTTTILANSISGGGSNKDKGIVAAEGKGGNFDDDWE